MRIKMGNNYSNPFSARFKWITFKYRTKDGEKSLRVFNDGAKDQKITVDTPSGLSKTEVIPKHAEKAAPIGNVNGEGRPIGNYTPRDGFYDNDTCNIYYNEEDKLYYSWMLHRRYEVSESNPGGALAPFAWVEFVSDDLVYWKEVGNRLENGREWTNASDSTFDSGPIGGSVLVDDGRFFQKGAVIFVASFNGGFKTAKSGEEQKQNDPPGGDGIGYFVFDKFGEGAKVIADGVFFGTSAMPVGNFRDPFLFYAGSKCYFAISHETTVDIYRINSFARDDNTLVQQIYVRDMGVEVPNVVRVGENRWYISCAVQDTHKEGATPEQRCWQGCYYDMFSWDESTEKFSKIVPSDTWLNHDFGADAYARRSCNPWHNVKIAPCVVSKATQTNWYYFGGFLPGVPSYNPRKWKNGTFCTEIMRPWDKEGRFMQVVPMVPGGVLQDKKFTIDEVRDGIVLKWDAGTFTIYGGQRPEDGKACIAVNNQLNYTPGYVKWVQGNINAVLLADIRVVVQPTQLSIWSGATDCLHWDIPDSKYYPLAE